MLGKYPLLPVFAFMLIGIFRGVNERRILTFSSGIKFMDAFKTGVSIAALFSLIYTLFIYLYITNIDDGFKNRFVSMRIAELEKAGTSAADINAWTEGLNRFPFYTAWLLFSFIGLMLIGLFYSAAIARMMSRKHPLAVIEKT